MPHHALDLLCMGNALVDIIASVSHDDLAELGSPVGSMQLIDVDRVGAVEAGLFPEQIMGGGSAANTAVIAAQHGIKVGYLGKVADDATGQQFVQDMQNQNVAYCSAPIKNPICPTGRCLVLITPDGERTMHTYLGISSSFGPEDVDVKAVRAAAITYMEGYLFDEAAAQAAFTLAAEEAHHAGRKVALTLSDAFCVQRHLKAFRSLVAHHIDILFANEAEICALYETEDFDEAARRVRDHVNLAALTRSEKGAVIVSDDTCTSVPTKPLQPLDTTGAGDAFAGGFLAGLVANRSLEKCAQLGNDAAGAIVMQKGSRPEKRSRKV